MFLSNKLSSIPAGSPLVFLFCLPRLFVKRGIYRIMMKEGEILTKGKRKEK
jgi:hypothetical protein